MDVIVGGGSQAVEVVSELDGEDDADLGDCVWDAARY